MLDISTPEFAEKINMILSKANEEESFKSALLADPVFFLKKQGLDLQDYQVIIEEHRGYGLYFALEHQDILHNTPASPEDNSQQQSFSDQHFMDCHHH